MITAGRIGYFDDPTRDDATEDFDANTVVAVDDEVGGRVMVRWAGSGGGVVSVLVDDVTWSAVTPVRARCPSDWWLERTDGPGPFMPMAFVFTIATMAERNNIALDAAYISGSGQPADVVEATVLDMGYAAGAILAQAVDTKRPIQVARTLEGMLSLAPAIHNTAYDASLHPERVLVQIPLDQVFSIRLRLPTINELVNCHCAYLLDAPNGYRTCAACKQNEPALHVVGS